MAPASKKSIAELEGNAEAAQGELAAAEAAFASAVQAMEAPPIELSDDQIGDLVDVKNLSEVRLVKARAAYRRADHALTEARKAAADKQRKDELTRVHSMGTAAQKQLHDAVTTATKQLRAAMRAMAEAELAREALNAKLPDEEKISAFEVAVMDAPGMPRKEISRTREIHWLRAPGQPYDEPYATKIKENGNGTATISHGGLTTTLRRRQFFNRTVFSDWMPSRGVGSLARELSLPGLRGAPAGWTPMRYVSPQGVLAELDRIEALATAAEPEPDIREELAVASPVFEDAESLAAWEAEQSATEAAA
jgi:hypothetical protein